MKRTLDYLPIVGPGVDALEARKERGAAVDQEPRAENRMSRYSPTGKPLTDYERELLTILMEECAEVTQAASKLLRFGKENRPPERDIPNTVVLGHEIGDLQELIEMVGDAGIISIVDVTVGRKRKRERLAFFMQTKVESGKDAN